MQNKIEGAGGMLRTWEEVSAAAPVSAALLDAALWTPGATAGERWGLPVLAIGAPGVGKTAITEAQPRRWTGWAGHALAPGRQGEAVFAAVPCPVGTEDGETIMDYPRPAWAWRKYRHAHASGVLLVDEYFTGRGLGAQIMGLTHGGMLGEYQLPPGVRIIAAANPVWMTPEARDPSLPERNRVIWLPWGAPPAAERRAWQAGGMADPTPADPATREAEIAARWPAIYSAALAAEAGFFAAQPHQMQTAPKDPAEEWAFASPRSWTVATRAYAGAVLHGLTEQDRDLLHAGAVGGSASSAFFAWLRHADLPDTEALLTDAGADGYRPNVDRLDREIAILAGIEGFLSRAPMGDAKVAQASAAIRILDTVSRAGAKDLAASTVAGMQGALVAKGPGWAKENYLPAAAKRVPGGAGILASFGIPSE